MVIVVVQLQNLNKDFDYDSFSVGMRECSHDASATGKCLSFKPYNASLFDKDTLFYNPSTGAMQPCFGVVTVTGKCTSYGMFNHSKATADKGQLYYDAKNKKMTTCSFVTLSGKLNMLTTSKIISSM